MNSVLIVAFHFPPQAGNSGLLRSLKFCRYLPECRWMPVVLSVRPRVYEQVDPAHLAQIPETVPVIRAWALDTQRDLSFRGRYFRLLALPDRWVSWGLNAIPAGLWAIYKHRVNVIFTTFPIATALVIGLVLHLLTRKHWIVDLRDPLTEEDYPRDPLKRRVYRWIERQVVRHAARLVFTAASTRCMYLKRYPQLAPEKCLLIPNGYDEDDFRGLESPRPTGSPANGYIRLLHCGLIYPEERDPTAFFLALARLKREGQIDARQLRVDLRAAGFEEQYSRLLQELQVDDIVRLLPPLPYQKVLQEGASADGLLVFQAACCDRQIPAKVYEYLRLQKPVLALTTRTGDTAALLEEVGGATIVDPADQEAIHRTMPEFLRRLRTAMHPLPDRSKVERFSRRNQARELARHLSHLIQPYPFERPA